LQRTVTNLEKAEERLATLWRTSIIWYLPCAKRNKTAGEGAGKMSRVFYRDVEQRNR
jgi:hypothetical protein